MVLPYISNTSLRENIDAMTASPVITEAKMTVFFSVGLKRKRRAIKTGNTAMFIDKRLRYGILLNRKHNKIIPISTEMRINLFLNNFLYSFILFF